MALETILYSQDFEGTNTIEVIHNLNRKDFLYVVVIDGQPRNDLITNIKTSNKTDNNKFDLMLSSLNDGYVLLIQNNYMSLKTNVITFEYDNGNSETELNIDWNNSVCQYATLNNNTVLNFINPENVGLYILKLKQDSFGGHTLTWPSIMWPNGTSINVTSAVNGEDIYTFYFNGTNWYFYNIQQNFS